MRRRESRQECSHSPISPARSTTDRAREKLQISFSPNASPPPRGGSQMLSPVSYQAKDTSAPLLLDASWSCT